MQDLIRIPISDTRALLDHPSESCTGVNSGVAFCWGIEGIMVPRLAALPFWPIQLHGLNAHTRRAALDTLEPGAEQLAGLRSLPVR